MRSMPACRTAISAVSPSQISGIVTDLQKQLKPGNTIQVIGQIQSMNSAFINLGIGLLFAAVFVYLLMVVNYQNFGDPFVVILALPATLCGILTMLFITGTTLNVPSLMGAIMAVGVASANSILLVTFAREQQLAGKTAFQAAIEAGHTRIRPVLMTAAAMIVGMIPMAIGGAGEEQNAALARAVIGGLLFATPTTLLVVPYLFAMLRKGNDGKQASRRIRRGAGMNFNPPSNVEPDETRTRRRSNPDRRASGSGDGAAGCSGFGVALALGTALASGAWSHYAQHREVVATPEQAATWFRRYASRPCGRAPAPKSSLCRRPPRRSRPPTSSRAPAAISTSARSISATT